MRYDIISGADASSRDGWCFEAGPEKPTTTPDPGGKSDSKSKPKSSSKSSAKTSKGKDAKKDKKGAKGGSKVDTEVRPGAHGPPRHRITSRTEGSKCVG